MISRIAHKRTRPTTFQCCQVFWSGSVIGQPVSQQNFVRHPDIPVAGFSQTKAQRNLCGYRARVNRQEATHLVQFVCLHQKKSSPQRLEVLGQASTSDLSGHVLSLPHVRENYTLSNTEQSAGKADAQWLTTLVGYAIQERNGAVD